MPMMGWINILGKPQETAGNRRKPQETAGNRRKPRDLDRFGSCSLFVFHLSHFWVPSFKAILSHTQSMIEMVQSVGIPLKMAQVEGCTVTY